MDISGNSLNQPVNFYQKSTGNNINYPIHEGNQLYTANVFLPEFNMQNGNLVPVLKQKKKSKNKRLNTVDTDYLPEETEDSVPDENGGNFFIEKRKPNIYSKILKSVKHFTNSTPLINYFFLKNKEKDIKNTVHRLYDINQDVDELMNTTVPFGEETGLYNDIAKNLTKAANIIGAANKKNW